MKVAHIINKLKRDGGAEALIYTFAVEAESHGIDCSIVGLAKNDAVLCEELHEVGISTYSFPGRRIINPVRFLKAYRLIKSLDVDVIHTHLTGSTLLGGFAAKLLKIPLVVTLHNVSMASQNHLYHHRLENWILKNVCKCVIAVGESAAQVHSCRIGNTPIVVIPNAVARPPSVDPLARGALRQELFSEFNGPIIVSIGRLTNQKGFENLIYSLARISRDYRCVIVGDGELRESLDHMISSLNLSHKIRLIGVRSDINEILNASDLYVSSSLWEGLPVATLEAMYAGLPIVATDVGDVGKVLRDVGELVPPGDIDALSERIENLLSDSAKRSVLGEQAFERVDKTYNATSWMVKQKDIYASVCS